MRIFSLAIKVKTSQSEVIAESLERMGIRSGGTGLYLPGKHLTGNREKLRSVNVYLWYGQKIPFF